MSDSSPVMEKIVALCKRRGFIFQSSEIYGGIAGFWDYGPLGTELKRNVKEAWWQDMVRNPPPGPDGIEYQMVGLDCSIIMNPKVWEASGHVGGFQDPMQACLHCRKLYRADQLPTDLESMLMQAEWFQTLDNLFKDERGLLGMLSENELRARLLNWASRIGRKVAPGLPFVQGGAMDILNRIPQIKWRDARREGAFELLHYLCAAERDADDDWWIPACPECGGTLTPPRPFNLMFETIVGAVADSSSKAYLRPETAQGIFVNFKNVMDSSRVKIPFGIAQIGKAFRNEINPRNYIFRSREFEQMEIEFFCKPDTSKMWYEFWRDVRLKWYESLGIKSEKLRPREQTDDELAHYSDACTDIEYLFPFSDEPQELEGVAHRGDFDLKAHGQAAKGKEMAFAVVDDATKERYVPHVIEPSAGVDRFMLAVICEAYSYDENRASPEFLKIHPRLAPIKAAVFPLVAKDGMPEIAEPIYRQIKKLYPCQYDAKQSIGKRYARMDEAGTPFCFTIDGQSKEDGTVTVRDRNDASQIRIDKTRCVEYLRDKLGL